MTAANELFDKWWCCDNPRERYMIEACLVHVFDVPAYITRQEFDFKWLQWFYPIDGAMYNTFINLYGLVPGEYEIEPGEFINVYFLEAGFYGSLYTYSLIVGLVCAAPCKILTYPL